jgi:ribosome-binding protein aMBF1 (putative translation factor)
MAVTDEKPRYYARYIICDFCGEQTRGSIDKARNAVVCDSCHKELRPIDWNKRQERSHDALIRLQQQNLETKKKHIKQLEKEVERLG